MLLVTMALLFTRQLQIFVCRTTALLSRWALIYSLDLFRQWYSVGAEVVAHG